MAKNKMNYGEKDLLPDNIERKDVKVKITMNLDGDVLDYYKAQSVHSGVPYQVIINRMLRGAMETAPSIGLHARFEELDAAVEEIREMLKKVKPVKRIKKAL